MVLGISIYGWKQELLHRAEIIDLTAIGIHGDNRNIADLSLRIYFRRDTDKIKVGYIGKHL
jgi:hypothetical protein